MDPMDHSDQHHLGAWDNVPSSPNEAGAGMPDMPNVPDTSGMQSLEEMQSMRDRDDVLDNQGGIPGMTGPGTGGSQDAQWSLGGQSGQASQSGQGLGMGDDSQVQEALDPSIERLDPNDPNVARDPVCGKLVDKRSAQNTLTLPGNGETLYFSSPECKANFEEDPHRYGYDY